MDGYCAARQVAFIPGANSDLSGAVPAGAVVSVYGAHLHKQATEDMQWPTAFAVPSNPAGGTPMNAGAADGIGEAKRAFRAISRERRSAARMAATADAGEAAANHFLTAIDPAPDCAISGYWPMGDEFDTRPLLNQLHHRGNPCALPVVVAREQPLVFRAWTPETVLVAADFGTSVPPDSAAEVTPCVLIVPSLVNLQKFTFAPWDD